MCTNYKETDSCLINIANKSLVSWDDFLIQMQPLIVSRYKGNNINDYKSYWRKQFFDRAAVLKLTVTATNSNKWSFISDILKNSDKVVESTDSSNSNFPKNSSNSSGRSTKSSVKNYELSKTEKDSVKKNYDSLTEHWVLSSGCLVENVFRKFIGECVYEHPVHSFIFDSSDENWKTRFTTEQLKEMMSYKNTPLPVFPKEYYIFLDRFKEAKTLNDLYKKSCTLPIDLSSDMNILWMKDTIMDIAKLFFFKKLPPTTTSSEAFYLNTVWGFVYKLFYGSKIDVLIGEKSSTASCIRRNLDRKLETVYARENSKMGHKIDIQFSCNGFEIGCAEVGTLQKGHNSDKHFNDGMLKLPKQLKDMMSSMMNVRPDLIRSLRTVGFVIMGNEIYLAIMDAPAGSICRISKTKVLQFPTDPSKILEGLIPLFQIVWKAKSIMENTINLLNSQDPSTEIDIITQPSPAILPPCFTRKKDFSKKRRQENIE